ncbi:MULTISPECIES: RNA-binding protein [unclassified Halanaerobium]|uniref:RNA-binding protein n=1 Tax=unclassified Halanaerobium TaxID=2641197 RepID=UPI000DF4A6AD|nr:MULTISPECIES: RNA-binding protein [unclassified Halanaerobium]RCW49296.1 hypothetical protein DFR78_106102 [Halanaerobium sp. MA284_MarDTE_T2]RCW84034.1 hypothetical protein DER71_11559 [Halanaerobium sp. DL-01]
MDKKFQPGEIVRSTAGRDLGNYYIVVEILSPKYILAADGKYKKINNPKKKNIKHIESTGIVHEEFSIWLTEGKRLRNEDIQYVLKNYRKKEEAK